MRRLGALLAAVVVVTAGALVGVPATAARADPVGDCSSTQGKIIAVDFHHWSGPVVRGCDPNATEKTSGISLLNDGGFRTTGTQHDGPQFLCRIGNEAYDGGTQHPTPSQDPCVVTPPASAYWSYWLAPAGQNHWSYSQFGAFSEFSKPGTVELWIFGGTDIQGSAGDPTNGFPTCTPNSLRAGGTPTSCTPTGTKAGTGREIGVTNRKHGTSGGHSSGGGTSHHGGSGGGGGSAGGAGSGTGGGTDGRHGSTGSRGAAPAAGTSSSATTPTGAAPASSSRAAARSASSAPASAIAGAATSGQDQAGGVPVAVDAKPASKTKTSAGSAMPLILGLCLAVLLAAGGGFTMWRRRRTE